MFFENWTDSIKENIRLLNDSLSEIDFRDKDFRTYIQLVAPIRINDEVKDFRTLLNNAIPNIREMDATIDGRKNHFFNHIVPLINRLEKEDWRKRVMEVRSWFNYKAEEFYKQKDSVKAKNQIPVTIVLFSWGKKLNNHRIGVMTAKGNQNTYDLDAVYLVQSSADSIAYISKKGQYYDVGKNNWITGFSIPRKASITILHIPPREFAMIPDSLIRPIPF